MASGNADVLYGDECFNLRSDCDANSLENLEAIGQLCQPWRQRLVRLSGHEIGAQVGTKVDAFDIVQSRALIFVP